MFADTGIQRVKIFDANGRIFYSDKRDAIGDVAAGSHGVVRALNGEVVSHFTHGVDHTDKGARTLEVYVPLRFNSDAAPVGVYEVYLSYTPTEKAIAEDTRTMYMVIAVGLLLVWAALYRIVSLASRRLRRQATHDALTGLPNRCCSRTGSSARSPSPRAATRARGPVHRPRPLQGDQRHARARLRRRTAASGRRCGCARCFAMATRWRAWAATSSPCCCRACRIVRSVELVADRLRDALHRSFSAGGTTLDVEASIGVALSPEHGTTADELLASADIAMYSAKERKAGAVFFDPQDRVNTPSRLSILGDLRRALEAGDQLSLHFQPKFALDDERLIGVEALLRWQHPERGNIPPAEFIELAEGTGIIHKLTERVLRDALAQSRRWVDAGHHVPIAVNLSTRCLLDTNLPEHVRDLLAEFGVPPELLRLEVTESAVMGDPARATDVLQRLHDLGVRLSIDDFGTGYTSMAYLRRLPVDELKVDRSFVTSMTDERARRRARADRDRPRPQPRSDGRRRGRRERRARVRAARARLRHRPGRSLRAPDAGR